MHTHVHRLTLGAAASVAALAVSAAAIAAPPMAEHAHGSSSAAAKAVALHGAMDKLWTDHVTWTRIVVTDFFSDAPSLKPDLARLLRNQVEIGDAVKPYYGAAAGNALTALLRTHIQEAVPVLAAARAGDKDKLTAALDAWSANGRRIAAFLHRANPASWPLAATTQMMSDHLKLTTNEAVAILERRWQASIVAYDAVREEILMMADTLANGIVEQFPSRFV
jgi:hypothetical protein